MGHIGNANITAVQPVVQLEDLTTAINTAWILLCTFLVFWEQAGFAMWEAGSLRRKNLHNILLKNLLDAGIGAVAFFVCGYAFAFGKGNAFIGTEHFFLADFEDYASWVFQWAFAATAATTVSGCMAERTEFVAYLVYTAVITCVIYPIAVHWVWADGGWLCAWGEHAFRGRGMIDFAGSGLVHMLGGVAGLVGSVIVGPRRGRFEARRSEESFEERRSQESFAGHSPALTALGVYCLWFGWFGFNAGYTLKMTGGMAKVAALICVNTALSPAVAGLTCLAVERARKGHYDLSEVLNATVAGLVGITGPCAVVRPVGAIVIGAVSGLVYCGSTRLHNRLKIDDPVGAIAVHAWPGLWGCIAPGLLAAPTQVQQLGYVARAGLFYGAGAEQLGMQIFGSLVLLLWTAVTSSSVFLGLRMAGRLRVSEHDEVRGLDISKHGSFAESDKETRKRQEGDSASRSV